MILAVHLYLYAAFLIWCGVGLSSEAITVAVHPHPHLDVSMASSLHYHATIFPRVFLILGRLPKIPSRLFHFEPSRRDMNDE